jgi:hypothetical protein
MRAGAESLLNISQLASICKNKART